MASFAYKSEYCINDLNGKLVEFAIPNETGRDAWARGEFEVAESGQGAFEINIVIASINEAQKEVLKKRSLTQYAINRITKNPNPQFADYQLFADGGPHHRYWHNVTSPS